MPYSPGDNFKIRFNTHEPDTGEAKDATSDPSATLIRNGDDTAETVTVSNEGTGDYSASGSIPSGWEEGDNIDIMVEATVEDSDNNPITAKMIIPLGVLDVRTSTIEGRMPQLFVSDEVDSTTSASVFRGTSDLSSSNDFYNKMLLAFIDGDLRGINRPITDYDGTNREFTVDPAFPETPSTGDKFVLIGRFAKPS